MIKFVEHVNECTVGKLAATDRRSGSLDHGSCVLYRIMRSDFIQATPNCWWTWSPNPENLIRADQTWKVRLTKEHSHRLMFEDCDT